MDQKKTAVEEQEKDDEVEIEEEEEMKDDTDSEKKAGKTFTDEQQKQVDELVRNRINRLKEKHAREVKSVTAEYEEKLKDKDVIQAELDALKAEKKQREWKENAAKEFGVPVDVIRGDTEEEIKEHAQQLQKSLGSFVTDFGPNSHVTAKKEKSISEEASEYVDQLFSSTKGAN
ncbi:MAG: hypothetical protein Q4E88_02780 [Coriobacteriia bacterium]|nr:hypothetical protein [Coriobacteriia bacterium]